MKKDWNITYNDPTQTAETLAEARAQKLMFYKRDCPKHGPMAYATLDQSCRKCSAERALIRKRENVEFNRQRELFNQRKYIAKKKDILFSITLEDVRNSFGKTCPALGIPFCYDSNVDTSPSIDKFDNSKGYTKDNIKIISTRANRIKSDGTADEHIKIAFWQLREQGMSKKDIINYFLGRV